MGLKYHMEEAYIENNLNPLESISNPPIAIFSKKYYYEINKLTDVKIFDYCFIGSINSCYKKRKWVIDFAKKYFTVYEIQNDNITTRFKVYNDYKLTLGEESSIVLKNTTTATSLTNGGSLISYGGASFQKDVFIGGQLDVNLQNIKNVADPIVDYDAVNKLYVDTAINNLDLNNNDKSSQIYLLHDWVSI